MSLLSNWTAVTDNGTPAGCIHLPMTICSATDIL